MCACVCVSGRDIVRACVKLLDDETRSEYGEEKWEEKKIENSEEKKEYVVCAEYSPSILQYVGHNVWETRSSWEDEDDENKQ